MSSSWTIPGVAMNHFRHVGSSGLAPYVLERLGGRLKAEAPRLFTEEAQAKVDFLDLGQDATGGCSIISSPRFPQVDLRNTFRFLAKSYYKPFFVEETSGS